MDKLDFKELMASIKEPWQPVDVAYVNDTALRIAMIQGVYDWHTHRDEDELFYVLKGKIAIDTPDGSVELGEREGYLVKQGTRHRSRAEKPAWILLVEPIRTRTKGE